MIRANLFLIMYYRIAGNFCGVFYFCDSAVFISDRRIKNRRIFFLFYLWSSIRSLGTDMTWDIFNMYYFYNHINHIPTFVPVD